MACLKKASESEVYTLRSQDKLKNNRYKSQKIGSDKFTKGNWHESCEKELALSGKNILVKKPRKVKQIIEGYKLYFGVL